MSDKRLADRLMLIGWDGVDLATLESLLTKGKMPHLASLMSSGACLELLAPRPTFSQAAWTSLATGKRPHEHGVLHAHKANSKNSKLDPITRLDRKCGAFWNMLSSAGLHTHVIGWPVSHPAEALAGINISDRFAERISNIQLTAKDGPSISPASAEHIFSARQVTPADVEEVTLGMLLPSQAMGLPEHSRVELICRGILAQTTTLFRAFRWCLSAQPWDIAACVFPGIRQCHELSQWLRRQSPTETEICQTLITGCYEHYDLLLGQLLTQVDDKTHVMVISAGGANAAKLYSGNDDSRSIEDSTSRGSGLAVIRGAGIRQNVKLQPRSILDFVPTILSMYGLPFGSDMSGVPLTELFEDTLAQETIDTWESTDPDSLRVRQDAIGEDFSDDNGTNHRVKHLIALGYVDPLDAIAHETAVHCERSTIFNRALSLLDAGLISQATTVLEQLTFEYPQWFTSRSLLAETYYKAGRRQAARREIDILICHGHQPPQLYLLSAAIEFADRRFHLAMQELSCARRGNVTPPGWSALKGNIQLRRGELRAAKLAFQDSIANDGPTTDSLDGLAAVNLRNGEYEEAALCALDALAKNMQCGKAHYHLAVALYSLDKPREALQALSSWAALEPSASAPYRWMAHICERQLKDLSQAESFRAKGRAVIRRRQLLRNSQAEGTSAPSSAE